MYKKETAVSQVHRVRVKSLDARLRMEVVSFRDSWDSVTDVFCTCHHDPKARRNLVHCFHSVRNIPKSERF